MTHTPKLINFKPYLLQSAPVLSALIESIKFIQNPFKMLTQGRASVSSTCGIDWQIFISLTSIRLKPSTKTKPSFYCTNDKTLKYPLACSYIIG